jgi:hypothetical protein
MCIGVCIDLFLDFNLFNKINALVLFVDSYYRTNNSHAIDLIEIKFIQNEIA